VAGIGGVASGSLTKERLRMAIGILLKEPLLVTVCRLCPCKMPSPEKSKSRRAREFV
jgi:hypothetical protein